ncbi:MAG: glycosyltransferase [Deltaproteobacteria bacterium]|nr:MAG: glycosyltransferase [Deltaproteobacteria bacterium]
MTRVAYFAPLLYTGGTQRHLQQVLRHLDPRRFVAHVYTLRPGGELAAELRDAGVPVTSLDLGHRLATPQALRGLVRAARLLRAARTDIVHGYQWRPALVGAVAGRLAGASLVLASKRSLTGDDRQARLAWRVIAGLVDTVVANADALRCEAQAHGVRGRWAVIPSGIDVDRVRGGPRPPAAKAALGLDPRRPVVGTVGRLEERKGHGDFLLAVRAMRGLADGLGPQGLIVGDGPLRARLERQAADLGLGETVHFMGAVADVRTPLAAMDVFLLPSRAEGMSNALLEAMAAGRPVVATAVGGTREAVDAERTGILVPPGDPAALAAAVLGLLADPARAAAVGRAAQRSVEEGFSAQQMVARLERLYAERLEAAA